jgi:hypothetical protein
VGVGVREGVGVSVEVAAGVRVIVGVDGAAVGDVVLWIPPQDANKHTPKISKYQTRGVRGRLDRKKRRTSRI